MQKITKKPTTALLPVPTVLVTCKGDEGKPNALTIAWTGIINSNPLMVYISVQPIRHSHAIIKQSGEYVINVPSESLVKEVDHCGVVSGRNVDKFEETGLTPLPATHVKAPLIAECPINIECRVKETLSLGSHDVFIAEVLAVHYNEDVLDENGKPQIDKIKPYGYCAGEYWNVNQNIGHYGYSKKS